MIADFILFIFRIITMIYQTILGWVIPEGVLFYSISVRIYWIVFVIFVARVIIWLYNNHLRRQER